MNHELIMLKGVAYCKKKAQTLTEECLNLALRSYSSTDGCGTLEQMERLVGLVSERDAYQCWVDIVKNALMALPRGYRSLLVAVYLKNIDKQQIGKHYNVSIATVYRKLALARKSFKNKLDQMCCDEQSFLEMYGHLGWVQQFLQMKSYKTPR